MGNALGMFMEEKPNQRQSRKFVLCFPMALVRQYP
jgi:hypothetical protein